MGAALGAALKPVAGQVIWAAAGRSDATSKRAELADLVAVPDIAELVARSDLVISICPRTPLWTLLGRSGPLLAALVLPRTWTRTR